MSRCQGPGFQHAVHRSPELLPVCKSPRWCRARPRSREPRRGEASRPSFLPTPLPTSRIFSPSHRLPGAWAGFLGRERRDRLVRGSLSQPQPGNGQHGGCSPAPRACSCLRLPQVLPVLRCSGALWPLTCGYSAWGGGSGCCINRINIAIGSGLRKRLSLG